MLKRPIALAFLAANLAACTESTEPPFDELPLRDALDADPAVIASMSAEARLTLAERLREARRIQAEAAAPLVNPAEDGKTLETSDVESLILSLDHTREAEGNEPLVAASLAGRRLLVPPAHEMAKGAVNPAPILEGADSSSLTAEAEASALKGEAGFILVDLARQTQADRFVRVSGWPIGAVAAGKTVYVNGAWLVAMASSEPAPEAVPTILTPPPLRPQDVPGNPYNPPESIADCTFEVNNDCETCMSGGECDDSPFSDISDGKAACEFLLADATRATALCVITLFTVDSLRVCVEEWDATCVPASSTASTSLDPLNVAIGSSGNCMSAYDDCLYSTNHGGGSSGGGSVCSVTGEKPAPGRKAILLFGPLLFLLRMSRIGRRGTWKAKS